MGRGLTLLLGKLGFLVSSMDGGLSFLEGGN